VGLLLAGALVGSGPALPVADAATATTTSRGYRCVADVLGQTRTGRIVFRRVVNARVQASRTSSHAFRWHPISWSLESANTWPDHEIVRYLVPSTAGRVREVETRWRRGGGSLGVRVLGVVGTGFPSRLIAGTGRTLYWLTSAGVLQRRTWTGRRFTAPKTLPVTITGATNIAAWEGPNATLVYVTDRFGALHVVPDDAGVADQIVSDHGFATTTGLKVAGCMSPDYVWTRSFGGILTVNRSTGKARFRRHLHPDAADGGSLTTPVRVPPNDWTWKRLG